ncbi:major facilitator superfamily domain-containing protein 6-A [Chelonus insularis]|uniref:major facilitator superfamily domain-containing protein 6-A n=1 Tax=Chelonus insularis TaxID=460826 RepID=UPI00158D09B2|nr:major facilitator superfamily domain-containing protein 6-A [Chelonus insularis]XP_034952173.1 major facilitator superfamily domain-containing protein 6-A [Chelonus insularis]XP_034952174.1 major facilitator superfamily domain-containing protein 6-A [Chelonus insularis]
MALKFKINFQQLPIKAHFFFFMAAMGPILPFLPVYGKQLGISAMAMGTVTAVLPILYFLSKPIFGFLVDYFHTKRKTIFIGILVSGSLAFVLFYFLPKQPGEPEKYLNMILNYSSLHFCDIQHLCDNQKKYMTESCQEISYLAQVKCLWHNNTLEQMILASVIMKDDLNRNPILLCWNFDSQNNYTDHKNFTLCDIIPQIDHDNNIACQVKEIEVNESNQCLYQSLRFWGFILLMSIGSISFNVTNSVTDAICFDILGEGGHMGYGRQRVWGTIGFGITALTAGYAIDFVSGDDVIKSYTPAFILVIVFTLLDIFCCTKLELPVMSQSENIFKDVKKLLKVKTIAIFLVFATIAGLMDSFIIYFMFWYLEDLAYKTNHLHQIKLIEGLIVAAETLGGEVIFFSLSGKILKKFGYGYSLTFCFICYSLRLALISIVPNPWWAILVELFMQGPTYGLCYTIIVGFASVVAPPGTSATVQGIVAGMDDGFGFALGSLLGGVLYKRLGGPFTLRIFSFIGAIAAISYFLLYMTILKNEMPKTKVDKKNNENIAWKRPKDAIENCDTAETAML